MTGNARDTQIYQFLMSNKKSITDSYRRLFECEVKASLKKEEMAFEAGRNTPFCTGGINLPESKSLLEALKRIDGKSYEEITEYDNLFIMAQVSVLEPRLSPMINFRTKIGRNDPCPCGSGRKYKNCHGKYES